MRIQLLVVAAVLTLAALGTGIWLLNESERLAGTNAVAPREVALGLEPGRRLCIRDLRPPGGTAAVRLYAGAPRAARLRVELRAAGAEHRSAASVAGPPRWVRLPIDELDRTVHGVLCVLADGGPVDLYGVGLLESDARAQAFLDGRALGARVAVEYGLAGEHSLLSRLDDAARHASRFKSGFVGPWTFWVLAAAIPLLWGAGLARLMRPGRGRLPGALLVALLAFANASAWALVNPAFEGPDEYAHVAYAIHLAETGRSPDPDSHAQFSSSESILALDATNAFSIHQQRGAHPPWDPAEERAWERRVAERRPARDDGGGGATLTSATHAPGYYAVPALAYRLRGGSFFDRFLAMRLASALLAAIVAACAFGIVRELAPGHDWAAVAAGLLVAFQPMFSFVGSVVNADNGVNAAAAALIYLLVRAIRRGLEPAVAAAIPFAFVYGVLAKATMLALAPVLGAALLLLALKRRSVRRAWLAMGASLAVLLLAWVLVATAMDRSVLSLPATAASRGQVGIGGILSYLWQVFLPHLPFMTDLYNGAHHVPAFSLYVIQTWAAFGWLSVVLPTEVYIVIALIMLALALLAVRTLWREWPAVRRRWAELSLLLLSFASVAVFAHLAFVRLTLSSLLVEQGRYFFPAIVAPAAIAALAPLGAGRDRAPLVATGLVAAVMAFCGFCQLYVFTSYYA